MIQEQMDEIIKLATMVKSDLPPQLTLVGKVIVEIGTARTIVAMVLDNIEKARNDDDVLYGACERIYTENHLPFTKKTQETWRRTRQYYQNKGWWEADPKVKEARMAKAKIWKGLWR
jgi:hypothetical protein